MATSQRGFLACSALLLPTSQCKRGILFSIVSGCTWGPACMRTKVLLRAPTPTMADGITAGGAMPCDPHARPVGRWVCMARVVCWSAGCPRARPRRLADADRATHARTCLATSSPTIPNRSDRMILRPTAIARAWICHAFRACSIPWDSIHPE
jgi:hypothetical protein